MSPRLPPKSSMLTRGRMGRGGGGGGGGGGAALVPTEVASAGGRPCAWGGHASARPPPNAAIVASIESCCRCRNDDAALAGPGSEPASPAAAPLPPEGPGRAMGCGLRSTSSSEPPHTREVDPSLRAGRCVAGCDGARLAPELQPNEHTGLCRTGGRLSDRPPENAPADGPACGVAPPGGGGLPSGGSSVSVWRTLSIISWSRRSSSCGALQL